MSSTKIFIALGVISLIGDGLAFWLALHSHRRESKNTKMLESILAHIDCLDATVENELLHNQNGKASNAALEKDAPIH